MFHPGCVVVRIEVTFEGRREKCIDCNIQILFQSKSVMNNMHCGDKLQYNLQFVQF